MLHQKSISALLLFTVITINAQNSTLGAYKDNYEKKVQKYFDVNTGSYDDLTMDSHLSYIPKKNLFSAFETSLGKYDFTGANGAKSSTKANFMTYETVNSDELAENLNIALGFKKRRHPMEKTGRILTYVGVPLAIIGGIMVAGADELYYTCVNGDCTGDARGGFGVVLLGAGAGLSGTGTVLWILGSKK